MFANANRPESAVRWIFVTGFVLPMILLAAISIGYGLERMDRFEVAVIAVDWLELAVNGILLTVVFRSRLRAAAARG